MAETLIFDLDNTLYPASCRLFDQVDKKMTGYVAQLLGVDEAEAHRVQKDYFHRYGTTLTGLMKHHNIPAEDFLTFVHDIDHSVIPHNQSLLDALDRFSGRKIIYTNGSLPHAQNILNHLKIDHHFEVIYDIVAADYAPKPALPPFEKLLREQNINPHTAIMFDDIPRNLEHAANLGMTTVWITGDPEYALLQSEHGTPPEDYIHHQTDDLAAWLHDYLDTLHIKSDSPERKAL